MAGLSLIMQTTDIVAKNMKLFSAAGVFSGLLFMIWNGSATATSSWMWYLCPVALMKNKSEREMKQIEQKFENAGKYCISKSI